MWYVWTSLLCLPLAIGDATVPDSTAASELAAPDVALVQEQPQPPQETGEKPKDAPPEKPAAKQSGPRLEGNRIVPEPQERPGPKEVEPPTGPMRIELFSISEMRTRFGGEPWEKPSESSLRLQVRLTGERLPGLVALGHLVIEELIDDTGAVLASPDDIKPRDLSVTTPMFVSKRVLAKGFIPHSADVKGPSRQARKLAKGSGWINVIYATETEDILIDNPLQYLGGHIEHPRLKELEINIRVIEPSEEIKDKPGAGGIALQFDTSRNKIRNTEFFDAWMKPMYARTRRMETADGEPYIYYGVVVGKVNADTQMVLTVFPNIEEEQIRFTFEDVELP